MDTELKAISNQGFTIDQATKVMDCAQFLLPLSDNGLKYIVSGDSHAWTVR